MIYDSLALFGYALGASDYLVLAPAGGASSTPVVANFKSKQKIANSFVADHSSEKTYIPKLILLMLLHLLEDLRLWEAEKASRVSTGRWNKRKKAIVNKRANLRKYIEECIHNTPPVGEEAHKSPPNLEDDNVITHDVITDYMLTYINYMYVYRSAAEEYIRTCNLYISITDEMIRESDGKDQVITMQSKSQYNGIRSALAYLFTLARVQAPTTLTRELSTFLKGMDRTIIYKKEILAVCISAGWVLGGVKDKYLFRENADEGCTISPPIVAVCIRAGWALGGVNTYLARG